jgi:hypothetical protein
LYLNILHTLKRYCSHNIFTPFNKGITVFSFSGCDFILSILLGLLTALNSVEIHSITKQADNQPDIIIQPAFD